MTQQAETRGEKLKVAIKGNLSEVFLSLQGEGIWVGTPTVFVRMTGCHRRCRYCDTEFALVAEKQARVWLGWRISEPDLVVSNPVSLCDVTGWVQKAAGQVAKWVSFTGGEPLLQADFLAELGKELKELDFKILLETEGGLPDRLMKVLPFVDAVAADIKLPSTTGEPLDWGECERFLKTVARTQVQACVKIVVTTDIDEGEFCQAVDLLAKLHGSAVDCRVFRPITLILQPVTPARFVTETPSMGLLLRLASLAQMKLPDVRIVPQVHKLMQLP
ncbi:MAG: 7-carboxy-7-deazaguanine synthase QueE [Armatimonadota bacterium]|nr:7-carboxy-7-deazaguanine synthase QueE [Armatimonadota bacterium]MDW8143780.1 7-carboxy-7-deazaguanine synthase QueE [Armatimonadota bacterium]